MFAAVWRRILDRDGRNHHRIRNIVSKRLLSPSATIESLWAAVFGSRPAPTARGGELEYRGQWPTGSSMTIMDIIRTRACKHPEVRTYEGVVFSQATCIDCGDITITSTDFTSRAG
jgi:hypothetical protein